LIPGKGQKRQIEGMVVQLEAQLKRHPEQCTILGIFRENLLCLNRIDDAINAYKKSISLDKNNSNTYSDLADLLAFQNKSIQQDALDLLNEALRLNPKNPQALALKGTAAFEKRTIKRQLNFGNWRYRT
jgi:cytochrome c-type biogenesis protein CcmH